MKMNHQEYHVSPFPKPSRFTKDKKILFERMLVANEETLDKLFHEKYFNSIGKIIDVTLNCGLDIVGLDVTAYDYMCYDLFPSHTVLCIYLPFISNDMVDRRNKLDKIIKNIEIDDSDQLSCAFGYEIYYYKGDEK